jgi:hypothetical protein
LLNVKVGGAGSYCWHVRVGLIFGSKRMLVVVVVVVVVVMVMVIG